MNTSKSYLRCLTSLRYFVALFVVLYNSLLYWPNFSLIVTIGRLGYLGVPFFFTLSGFVLYWNYDPGDTYINSLKKRISKIYPIHVCVLILFVITRFILKLDFGVNNKNILGAVYVLILIRDWFVPRNIIDSSWNPVSWTLSCLLFYYLIAPILFKYIYKIIFIQKLINTLIAIWLMQLASSNTIAEFIWHSPPWHLIEFVMGATLAKLFLINHDNYLRAIYKVLSLEMIIFVIFMPLGIYLYFVPQVYQIATTISLIALPGILSLILFCTLQDIYNTNSILKNNIFIKLGSASFSLYIIQILFLNIFVNLINHIIIIQHIIIPMEQVHYYGFIFTLLFTLFITTFALFIHNYFATPCQRCTNYILNKYLPLRIIVLFK